MKIKTNFTPGEWKIRFMGNGDEGDNDFFVEAKNNNRPDLGYGIEIMQDDFGDHNGYPRSQKLADAKLIAAAPKLLDACLKALMTIREGCATELTAGNLEKAIKEAID